MTVNDATTSEIVRRELYDHAILWKDLDVMLTHLPRDMTEHDVPILQFDTEHSIRQRLNDGALDFNDAFFFRHYSR